MVKYKSASLLILITYLLLFTQSCKKEDSNPTQPIDNSKRELFIGTWSNDSNYVGGVKSVSTLPGEIKVIFTSVAIRSYYKTSLIQTCLNWKLDESANEVTYILENGVKGAFKLVSYNNKNIHWQYTNIYNERVDQYLTRE